MKRVIKVIKLFPFNNIDSLVAAVKYPGNQSAIALPEFLLIKKMENDAA